MCVFRLRFAAKPFPQIEQENIASIDFGWIPAENRNNALSQRSSHFPRQILDYHNATIDQPILTITWKQ